MEPKLPAPNIGPEYSALNYERNQPESEPSRGVIERGGEHSPEQIERQREVAPPVALPSVTPVLPAPVAPILPPATDDAVVVTDTPLVANDDDLIEKEWVDKAKKIIVETKDDPYRREREVGKLQTDYLLKRYGKELGASQP